MTKPKSAKVVKRKRAKSYFPTPPKPPRAPKLPRPAREPEYLDGVRIYSVSQASAITGYSKPYIYVLLETGVIEECSLGRLSQSTLDFLIERRKQNLQFQGRPKAGPNKIRRKVARSVTLTVSAYETLERLMKAGNRAKKDRYKTEGDVLLHIILHAEVCPMFKPGESEAVWDESNQAVKIDTSGL